MAAGARYRHERALSAPTRVVDNLHGISAPTRVVDTSARYIPLAVSTTPSRCQRPPHGADNARPYRQRALELAPGPTTRVHTRAESSPCVRPSVAQSPPLCATPADTDTEKGRSEGADPPTNGEPNQQTSQPAKKGAVNRMGPARTTWGAAPAPPGEPRPHRLGPAPAPLRRNPLGPSSGCGRCRTTWGAAPAAPPYGSGFTARCRATMPPVRLRYWTSDQPLRAIMAPRARWSGHWRIDSTK